MAAPWIAQLSDVLIRMHFPVEGIVAAGGALRITLRDGQSPAFIATLRPRSGLLQGWATTARFVLGYEGALALDPTRQRWMELLLALFRRIENRLPPRFDAPDAAFDAAVPAQEQFRQLFPFANVERSFIGDEVATEVLVRATSLCNQRCPFCSASHHATPSPEAVSACIRQAASIFPGAMLSLTGGEPTLRKTFLDEVRLALATDGVGMLQVQTNAVAFAAKLDPASLPATPRLTFFVSLHALDESLYDRCTGTTGQFSLAKEGIARIIQAGHRTTVNCVVNAINVAHLGDYVRTLSATFPRTGTVDLHFSTLICAERKPGAADFLVRYPALAVSLQNAVELARSKGIAVQSLRASTHAAIPACMLDDTWRAWNPHRPKIAPHETGSEEDGRDWVKSSACGQCSESDYCLGVPRPYASKFGLADLHPLRRG